MATVNRLVIALVLGLLLAGTSCVFTDAHELCHQRALEQLGCCPFHSGDDCDFGADDRIREACEQELADLFEDETTVPAGTEDEPGDGDDGHDEARPEPH